MAEDGNRGLGPKAIEGLEAMRVDIGALDGRTVDQLARIEMAIESEVAAYRTAKAEMRAHMLTIEGVSRAAGVSRPTIYAKKVLMGYIELRRAQEGVSYDGAKAGSLKARLKDAEEKIEKLLQRDGELVVALAEVDRLKERNKRLEEYIGDLPPYMREELDAMGKIVPFPGSFR